MSCLSLNIIIGVKPCRETLFSSAVLPCRETLFLSADLLCRETLYAGTVLLQEINRNFLAIDA